ncbi:neurotensin/neuromedin N [Cyprinodon tularosa]|uniref:neurotensin/neuromedin N n=1 Tax=Cyprinodon tularosa TaxID=77115 RepID=UPI0018E245F0|nr:neurotensin/neuromedin N [Cyprinodon tularosa]
MQAQLACMILLCVTCGTLCTDVEQEQRTLADDLLTSLLTSKMTYNRQSAPYWHVSLTNLCRLVAGLQQEAWSGEEKEEEVSELREGSLQLLGEVYSLQHFCRALQSREERLLPDSMEYSEENSDAPLKRKSPYILKRQAAHNTKSRRPYILKRSSAY